MIDILTDKRGLILEYQPDAPYLEAILEAGDTVTVYKVFRFQRGDLVDDVWRSDGLFRFRLAVREGSYYEIEGRKLGIGNAVRFSVDEIKLATSIKSYRAVRGISVFRHLHKIVNSEIIVGGDQENALPVRAFTELVTKFPNSYELDKYADARVAAVVTDYFDKAEGVIEVFKQYRNRRVTARGESLIEAYRETEQQKYSNIKRKLEDMLQHEEQYNEAQWQDEILEIIRLLYPKYIYAIKGALVKDSLARTNRKIDILLVDANGHVDIVELKKPFGISIISNTLYRDNHVPLKALAGTVMQVEKYIYHLNRAGQRGENRLKDQLLNQRGVSFDIRITNPSGIIIMGREDGLTSAQKNDFEVVKRKYKNVIDVVTYDDLLRRISAVIESFSAR